MAETSIQRARRLAKEKREREEAAEAAPKAPAKKPEKEEGFFSSFFNRSDKIDAAVEAAQRDAQTTDNNNE